MAPRVLRDVPGGTISGTLFPWASGPPAPKPMVNGRVLGRSSIGVGGYPGHRSLACSLPASVAGRTIREFMIGVLFVPTTIAFFWLCMFGGNAIYMELNAAGGVGTAGISQNGDVMEPTRCALRHD